MGRGREFWEEPRFPLKRSFKGNIDIGIGIGIDTFMDIDSDSAVSTSSGSFQGDLGLLERAVGLI